ncbi:restriction endonuclease [Salinisphaera shabanensis]|uniref:restriction endonuclease n=1 Tax=Salinisphaera shabanensis TaxID=180542 RepID=UPI00333F5FE6
MSWLQFEHLIAASYRRKGFTAELTAEGADEGVDIVLRERDNVLLVQCKHWNSYQVGVSVARELFGVMHAKRARKAVLATSGRLTVEAERFCRENAIYWLDAKRLPAFIDPAAMPPRSEIAADRDSRCPLCGATMVQRTARKSGHKFWGCVRYPACRGKRFAAARSGEMLTRRALRQGDRQ